MADFTAANTLSSIVATLGATRVVPDAQCWLYDVGGAVPSGTLGLTKYLMRAFDANVSVNKTVFWASDTIDSTGATYAGSAGPLTDICYVRKV